MMANLKDLNRLSPEELIALVEKCDAEIARLTIVIKGQEAEITKLNGLIEKLGQANVQLREQLKELTPPLPTEVYNEKWEWVKKLVYIVRYYNRPVSSSEILDYLLKHDTVAQYWKDKTKYLSVQLNKATKYKMLIPQKNPGMRNLLYLLPEWVSEKKNS